MTADARWYAVYEEATYTVSFYDADYELIDSSEVTFGQYFPVPEYTGRVPEGKTFLCWQGDDGQMLLPEFNGLMSYTHDLTFNPVFSDNTEYCLVKFMVGGELHDAKLYERVSGQTLTLPAEPTKPGYTFPRLVRRGRCARHGRHPRSARRRDLSRRVHGQYL